MKLTRLLKEPLLHFIVIGALLYALYAYFAGAGSADSGNANNQIVVSAGQIRQLEVIFTKTWQRPPNDAERAALIDDFVLEEIYYRQAIAMGIDRDDAVIRRRLRQKLEFLTDDMAGLFEPTDQQLATYIAANPDKFRISPAYTFKHIYFSPTRHGKDPQDYVRRQRDAARAGQSVLGDASLIPDSFDKATRHDIDRVFGRGFSSAIDELSPGQWHGPIRSGLGMHLVWIQTRTPARLPPLAEIRPIVQREWANAQRVEMRRATNERFRSQYEIIIESTVKASNELAPPEAAQGP